MCYADICQPLVHLHYAQLHIESAQMAVSNIAASNVLLLYSIVLTSEPASIHILQIVMKCLSAVFLINCKSDLQRIKQNNPVDIHVMFTYKLMPNPWRNAFIITRQHELQMHATEDRVAGISN